MNVGDKLYFVPFHLSYMMPRYVTVLKIGRKWAELDNGRRVDIATMTVDGKGYSSPGRCYKSEEEYTTSTKLAREWEVLRCRVSNQFGPPKGMTIEKISQIKGLLEAKS